MTDLGPLPLPSSDEGTKRQVLTTRRATLLAMSEVPLCPSKRTGIAAVISRSSMGWQKSPARTFRPGLAAIPLAPAGGTATPFLPWFAGAMLVALLRAATTTTPMSMPTAGRMGGTVLAASRSHWIAANQLAGPTWNGRVAAVPRELGRFRNGMCGAPADHPSPKARGGGRVLLGGIAVRERYASIKSSGRVGQGISARRGPRGRSDSRL
jgi:hypothetical protein